MSRNFIYRHYWWIALLSGSISLLLIWRFFPEDRAAASGGAIAVALGFCYFAQQQKLAETKLFYQIFTDFNRRYDDLNDALYDIAIQDKEISLSQRNTVVDYFNLCAEEYLFYKEGFIPADVWRSWCRGMSWYLRRHPFKDIWNEEIESDSFYGLSSKIIQEGVE